LSLGRLAFLTNKKKMNNIIIKRSYLVQARINALGTLLTFNFDDVPEISKNNIVLYGIEAFTADQMAVSPIDGATVIDAAGAPSVSFTLIAPGNKQEVQTMPVYNAIRSNNNGNVLLFEGIRLNLTSCYITLASTANLNANEVVLFNLYYDFAV